MRLLPGENSATTATSGEYRQATMLRGGKKNPVSKKKKSRCGARRQAAPHTVRFYLAEEKMI